MTADFQNMFVSRAPQAAALRSMERVLALAAIGAVARMVRVCPDLGEDRGAAAPSGVRLSA